MRLIREKVKHKGQDIHLPLRLTANSNLNGLQEAINDFIEEETGLSINPVNDIDTFRYLPENTDDYTFYFYSGGSIMDWANSYEYAGFTSGETASRSEVVARSFFLVQLYNAPETENQRLLHNGYYNGFSFLADELEGNSTQPDYSLTDFTEFTNFYIPNDFINLLSGVTTVYGKLSFYNAKTGSLQLFYPSGATDPPTGDTGLYVEYQINPTGKTYTMTTVSGFKEFSNQEYIDKINNTLDSFNNEKPTYPTGNTFLNTGKYEIT